LSILVNFLLLFNSITNYTKDDIDKGNTPPNIYKICSCIRETFCLSYSIRKGNVLYLYFQKQHALIKFEGRSLRFLGPDERSQALLLKKVLNKIYENSLYKKWIESTPGIFGRTFSNDRQFIEFYTSIAKVKNYLIIDTSQNIGELELMTVDQDLITIKEIDFFIIPNYNVLKIDFNFAKMLKDLKAIYIVLPKLNSLEDILLYINFRKDQQH
jgi:tRNA pseudouridine-54 N-methylase